MTMTSWPVPHTGPMLLPVRGPRHRRSTWRSRVADRLVTAAMVGGLFAFAAALVVTL